MNIRYYVIDKTYGGKYVMFVDNQSNLIVEYNTMGCSYDFTSEVIYVEIPTRKSMREIKEYYLKYGYEVVSVDDYFTRKELE